MIQAIALIKKRDDITLEQFVHHYETIHVPLAIELCKEFSSYSRNHIVWSDNKPWFDVISKFSYRSVEDMITARALFTSPAANRIKKDELIFMDVSTNRSFLIEQETSSSFDSLYDCHYPNKLIITTRRSSNRVEIQAQIKQITDRLEGIKGVSNNIIQHNSDSEYDFFNEVWFETPQTQEKAILTFSNTKLFTNVLKISPCYTQLSER